MIGLPPTEYVKWSGTLKGPFWHKMDRAPEGWLGPVTGLALPLVCSWYTEQTALPLRTVWLKRVIFGTKWPGPRRLPSRPTAGWACRWSLLVGISGAPT